MNTEIKGRFDWLPAFMPGVVGLMKIRRAEDGDAHVNECWRRGVIECEPGWFFAREGAIAVGVPGPDWMSLFELKGVPGAETAAMLILRDREVTRAAN